jgi:hypothetical protein
MVLVIETTSGVTSTLSVQVHIQRLSTVSNLEKDDKDHKR